MTAGGAENAEPKAPQALRIRLFGALEIDDGSRVLGPRDLGGARPKQVLELLLAGRGHRVPTDRLAERLWGEELPLNAAGSLQTFVSVLRRHLSPDRERARELVVTEAEAYRFATDLVELDLDRFDELVERSAREPTGEARRSLEQALALVRGEVLEDEPYALWAEDLRGTYRGRVLGAHLEAADVALAELDYAAGLAHAVAAAELHPRGRPALARVLPELALEQRREFADVEALEALAEVIAEQAPLVLLIDDLHWSDSATVAALSYLRRRCAGEAAALVVAARSEELPLGHPVRRLGPTTQVRLEPLTATELAPLGVPQLHESTGGHPW